MKAIVTVIGEDRVGIIAAVSTILADHNVNILDIRQTVMDQYFTMIMLVDLSQSKTSFADLSNQLNQKGEELGLSIRIQQEDIFKAMHQI